MGSGLNFTSPRLMGAPSLGRAMEYSRLSQTLAVGSEGRPEPDA